MTERRVATCLFLESRAEEAAALYVSLVPDSRITRTVTPDPAKPPMLLELEIGGAPFVLMNGNPTYASSYFASIQVYTEDQAETDRLWDQLLDRGEPGRCGWLTDRYGVYWQVVPRRLPELMATEDASKAARVQAALMPMTKINIATLEAAAAAES